MIVTLKSSRALTKTHRWTGTDWESDSFDDPFTFDVEEIDANGIEDLALVLEYLSGEPNACVIHGELIEGMPRRGRRILHDQTNRKTGVVEKARFRAPDRVRWLCLDVDTVPTPSHLRRGNDPETLQARLDHVVGLLPTEFREASYAYQWSSSAGLRDWDILKVHLWFWIAEGCDRTLDEVKARAQSEMWDVDLRVFSPVQVHYTAAPRFRGGDDHLAGKRTGFVRGARDSVILPHWVAPPKPVLTTAQRLHRLQGGGLDEILDRIGSHLHGPISHAISHYVAMTPPEVRNPEWLKGEIRLRVLASLRRDRDDYLDEDYLDRSYWGAVSKFPHVDTRRAKVAHAMRILKTSKKVRP